MKKILFTVFLSVAHFISIAQKDTAFWFACPDVSSAFGYDKPNFLRFTSYQLPCTITVSVPANSTFIEQTISLAPFTTQSLDLTQWIDILECTPGNVVQNRGIKIKSNNKIAVYYEANSNGPNPELFALKGKNSLGTLFYISSQSILYNADEYIPLPVSSFNIVATEDNTVVTITPSNNIVRHSSGTPFNILLNKGQTYAAVASSQAANQHLGGSSITSSKPIAITISDDLLNGGSFGSTCRDGAGDQTVPVNVLGNEYIAIRGELNSPFDKVYMTATQNATNILQDGVSAGLINAGQTIELTITKPSTYIQTSAPAYAYQLTGVGCEVGSAVLPKINCTGSSSVSVTRSSNEALSITLLVKDGGQNSFLINNVPGIITGASFSVVPSTGGQWYFAKINLPLGSYPNGSVIKIDNTLKLFQLGFLQGGSLGASFGYFSDYNATIAEATTNNNRPCIGSNVTLNAETVSSATYKWQGPAGFSSNLQNPILNNIQLSNSGSYYVDVTVPDCGVYRDSINILVLPKSFSTVNISICPGQNYQGHNTAGTFIDTYIAANGCDSIRTLNLTIKLKSFFTLNQTICEGENFEGYSTTGVYIKTFVAANGCDSIRTLNLKVKSKSFFTLNQSICEGETFEGQTTSGTFVKTFQAANGCDSIRTLNLTVKQKSSSFLEKTICKGEVFEGYTQAGEYLNTYVSANGCDSIRRLSIKIKEDPKPFLGKDTAICGTNNFLVTPGIFDSYLWQDGTTKSTYNITMPGIYSVTVANQCGSAKDEITVIPNTCDIFFPNIFTPNNDNNNDEFKILNAVNLKDYKLEIYTRLGEKVFETSDYKKGWDGTKSGAPSDIGTYVWYSNFKKGNVPLFMKGFVILMR